VSYFSRDEHLQALAWRRLFLAKAKLRQASNTSALLAGFAMVAMVETSLESGLPQGLLLVFGVSTTLVVVVHLLALMASTCLLPDIEAISETNRLEELKQSPHDQLHVCVELAWVCSTGLGIFLFMVQMGVISWVRFYNHSKMAFIGSMFVIVPAIVVFALFAVRFYHRLIKMKYKHSEKAVLTIEAMANEIGLEDSSDVPITITAGTVKCV